MDKLVNKVGKWILYCLKKFFFDTFPFPDTYPAYLLFLVGPMICTCWKDKSEIER